MPLVIAPFQNMMEENWDTGNAKETALYMHGSAFDREDYSRDVNKKRLGNGLLKFVREFTEGGGNEEVDDILHSGFASNELPPTPIDTMVSLT